MPWVAWASGVVCLEDPPPCLPLRANPTEAQVKITQIFLHAIARPKTEIHEAVQTADATRAAQAMPLLLRTRRPLPETINANDRQNVMAVTTDDRAVERIGGHRVLYVSY